MPEVRFYLEADDRLLKFAVIVARYQGQWVFCKHRKRNTYECPGGHREPGEPVDQAAARELYEETGAKDYRLAPVCSYSVYQPESGEESYGMLYFAEIQTLGPLPAEFEMERIELFTEPPANWTYPEIQPQLLDWVRLFLKSRAASPAELKGPQRPV